MVERARAKENCTKDSDSNPSVVSRDVLGDTAIGVRELATRNRSVDLNKSMQRTIQGKTHNQSKGKGIGKGKRKHPGTGNQNQDQAGSPDEGTGQRKLDDFGIKRQRVELVGDVPGTQSGSSSLCVFRSKVHEWHDGLDEVTKFVKEWCAGE